MKIETRLIFVQVMVTTLKGLARFQFQALTINYCKILVPVLQN